MSRLLSALLAAFVPVAALAAESFTIDPIHSSVNFKVDHLGLAMIHGRFSKFGGKFSMDRAAKTGGVDLSIETASVDTGDQDKGSRPRSRDDHLRTADFFNAAEFPRMTFKSTKVVYSGENPSAVEGDFTLLGVSKPVTLQLVRFKCNPATATAKERCGGDARGSIKRSDFGMKRGIPSIGDEILLEISFEGDKD